MDENIKKRLKIISDLQEEINRIKEAYNESLESDSVYQEAQEEIKKVKEETRQKTIRVKESPTLRAMEEEIKELRRDVKENKEILSQSLIDYYRESGKLEIEDEKGNIKRIKFSVRLVDQKL